jgi:crossover junction endodeoxyribonuclease RuvC
MSARTWLGLDPSIQAFGWAVMRREPGGQPFVRDLGTWHTRIDDGEGKMADRARRVRELTQKLVELLTEHRPQEAYVESLALGMRTGRGTVQTLGRVRGIVEGVCFCHNVELAEVRPDVVKQAVTGRRDATKEQVARTLAGAYATPLVLNADTNATDALAVAHVGAYRAGHGVTVTSGVVSYRSPSDDDLCLD